MSISKYYNKLKEDFPSASLTLLEVLENGFFPKERYNSVFMCMKGIISEDNYQGGDLVFPFISCG